MEDKTASHKEFEQLVTRVMTGIICCATEDDIRRQLTSEGIDGGRIEAAITKGVRAANVRLGWE